MSTNTIERIFCNTCKHSTRHKLGGESTYVYQWAEDPESGYEYEFVYVTYRFWECQGCGTGTMSMRVGGEPFDPRDIETEYYPPRTGKIREPKEFVNIPAPIDAVYKEVIAAYNQGLHIVAAMGLRALIEGICVDNGITDDVSRGLKGKLEALRKRDKDDSQSQEQDGGDSDVNLGILPGNIVDALERFKFIGDSAAHRLEKPEEREVELALDVTDDLLNYLYETEYRLAESAARLTRSENRTRTCDD